MTANDQIARQLSDAEFAAALSVIKQAGRNYTRACALADVVKAFVGDLDGMNGLSDVEDAAAGLTMALDCCYAPPEQIGVYRRQV